MFESVPVDAAIPLWARTVAEHYLVVAPVLLTAGCSLAIAGPGNRWLCGAILAALGVASPWLLAGAMAAMSAMPDSRVGTAAGLALVSTLPVLPLSLAWALRCARKVR